MKKKCRHHHYTITLFFSILIIYGCSPIFKTPTPAGPERFSKEIETFINCDAKNSSPENAVLFVGSSSIKNWDTALFFPDLKILNRGFGGSHISDVNYYYDQIVKKYKPAQIIFYAGDNDIAAGKSATQVYQDFSAFAEKAERDLPQTRIYFIAIKPSISRWKFWAQMSAANTLVQQYVAKKSQLFFIDIVPAMLNETFQPDPGLFVKDGLHLNDTGYKVWTEIVSTFLKTN